MTGLSADRADLTVAYAISDVGDIARMSWPLAAGPGSPMGRAVAWEAGTMVDLGTCLDVPCSAGLDINTFGEIIGWSVDEEIKRHAYIWDGVSEPTRDQREWRCGRWFETEKSLNTQRFGHREDMTESETSLADPSTSDAVPPAFLWRYGVMSGPDSANAMTNIGQQSQTSSLSNSARHRDYWPCRRGWSGSGHYLASAGLGRVRSRCPDSGKTCFAARSC